MELMELQYSWWSFNGADGANRASIELMELHFSWWSFNWASMELIEKGFLTMQPWDEDSDKWNSWTWWSFNRADEQKLLHVFWRRRLIHTWHSELREWAVFNHVTRIMGTNSMDADVSTKSNIHFFICQLAVSPCQPASFKKLQSISANAMPQPNSLFAVRYLQDISGVDKDEQFSL